MFENVITGKVLEKDKTPMSFTRLESDPAVFFDRGLQCVLSKHVDDGLITGPQEKMKEALEGLKQFFLMRVTDTLEAPWPADHQDSHRVLFEVLAIAHREHGRVDGLGR